jgi:hypothetical protein
MVERYPPESSIYYSKLFGWEIDSNNPMNHGIVPRQEKTSVDGIGIGVGIGAAPEGYSGHVTLAPLGRGPCPSGALRGR